MAVVRCLVAVLMFSAHPAFSYALTTELYYTFKGRQCRVCPAGQYQKSCAECAPCSHGFFTSSLNSNPNCKRCFTECRQEFYVKVIENCTLKSDIICRCEDGYRCIDLDKERNICKGCEKIPQPTRNVPSAMITGKIIKSNKTGISSEHSTTSPGSCQPPHCGSQGPPVATRGNNTHLATAQTSRELATILCPLLIVGIIIAFLILMSVRRPGDETCFKQVLKLCNEGVRDASPHRTKETTRQHARDPQSSGKHQPVGVEPLPVNSANLGPVHVHSTGTVIFSLLSHVTGLGGPAAEGEKRGQRKEDEEEGGGGFPADPMPSPHIHLSQEEGSGEGDCVFFPSQEQGKESHMSKEEVR